MEKYSTHTKQHKIETIKQPQIQQFCYLRKESESKPVNDFPDKQVARQSQAGISMVPLKNILTTPLSPPNLSCIYEIFIFTE